MHKIISYTRESAISYVDPFSWKIAPKAFFMKAVVTPPATTFAVLQINCSVPILQFLDIAVLTSDGTDET